MITHFCDLSGKETELLTIKEACYAIGISRRTLQNWVHRHQLHFKLTPSRRKLICKCSLICSESERQRLHQVVESEQPDEQL